ncbi:TPA: hypothetical protein K0P24_002606 [Citrobacter farmeri]|uniref:Uncharacterized protein n=1 Tax=Citrobacter farmeri TaxID=67824 RepID=A0ACA8D7R2_9ENTR|nr:hypothetical protein [Citrobacter farmeri]AST80269.1 hypothetical protein CI104_14905 [Citrobacter farmeri]HAT2749953.1 hypothetical protein [Citrobacter farmeri]HBI2994291.1 hypothetical protein [Citrobacter farmeri]HBI2999319.1 hypothetical protein [Citrobacter farmeri]HBI3004427.1 hypothetical protein [Citrobacter farmeri]
MRELLLIPLFLVSLSVSAADSLLTKVKESVAGITPVDATEWYKKGDTNFAEYEGEYRGFNQKIKVAVKSGEIHIKSEISENDSVKDMDIFMRETTQRCHLVFRDIILPAAKLEAVTDWDNDESDGFEFMDARTVPEATRNEALNGTPHKNIYGWDISIRRESGKTACSAIKR